jgi:hypothetical protein
MTEEIIKTPYSDEEVSDDDKLWAMLSWIPFVGIVLAILALLMEPQKDRAFVRFHAVQAIGANVIIGIAIFVLGFTPLLYYRNRQPDSQYYGCVNLYYTLPVVGHDLSCDQSLPG